MSLFCWFDHFLYTRAEICQIFRCFFGKFKISKGHSEVNRLLVVFNTVVVFVFLSCSAQKTITCGAAIKTAAESST